VTVNLVTYHQFDFFEYLVGNIFHIMYTSNIEVVMQGNRVRILEKLILGGSKISLIKGIGKNVKLKKRWGLVMKYFSLNFHTYRWIILTLKQI